NALPACTGYRSCATAAWSSPSWSRRPTARRSARHRHATLLQDDPPLGLGQAAPHTERLAGLQRELTALLHHRATPADLFGLSGAPGPRGVALAVGVEE